MPTPPSRGPVSSPYGMRINPNDGIYRMHYGEDTLGEGNYAPVTGTVVFSGYDNTGTGLGYAVGIREDAHPSVIWWVAHHSSLEVGVGDRTREAITYLGAKGESGAAKGVHCHTERRVGGVARPGSGVATNPRSFYTNTAGSGVTPISRKKNKMHIIWTTAGGGYLQTESGTASLTAQEANLFYRIIISDQNHDPSNFSATDPLVRFTAAEIGIINNKLSQIAATSNGGFTAADRAMLDDIASKGELTQALTSTVSLVNEHADANKDEIIAAIPSSGSGGSTSAYNLSLEIEQVPGTATGTATPQ